MGMAYFIDTEPADGGSVVRRQGEKRGKRQR